MNLKLPMDLANTILSYLQKQPWGEVNNLMADLSKLEQLKEEPEAPPTEE
jgi:hypothetical protein